jgi:hypothetical protein
MTTSAAPTRPAVTLAASNSPARAAAPERRPRLGADRDARRPVRIHHHDQPVTATDRPAQGLGSCASRLGHPVDRSEGRRRNHGPRMLGDVAVAEGGHARVTDRGEIPRDIAGWPDGHQDGPTGTGGGDPDPDVPREPAEPCPWAVHLHRVADQGVTAGGVHGGARGQIAALLFLIRPGQDPGAAEQHERDENQRGTRDQRDDTTWRPARPCAAEPGGEGGAGDRGGPGTAGLPGSVTPEPAPRDRRQPCTSLLTPTLGLCRYREEGTWVTVGGTFGHAAVIRSGPRPGLTGLDRLL